MLTACSLNGKKSAIIPTVYMVDSGRAGGRPLHQNNRLPVAPWPRRWRTERLYKKNMKRGSNHVEGEPFVSSPAGSACKPMRPRTCGDRE